MSEAGIRSNRGDGYQTLVAFDWALTVLADPDYQWLEIDSIIYSVDDVVVGKTDGTLIACQCKKNQIDFKAWTIKDLADELDKASCFLARNQNAEVRFYSRNNFGALAKLREHSSTQNDENSYRASLGKAQKAINISLSERIINSNSNLSVYEFLSRTSFETSPEINRYKENLRERLHYMASNPDAAFNALWASLDQLGARMCDMSLPESTQHRLTKADLRNILHNSGAMLSPPMNVSELRSIFSRISGIGRSWRRDIAGLRISSSTLKVLLEAIDAKKRAILLTGLPGSGKTCVMLALQEELERRAESRSDIVPLFIQSREFADFAISSERQALGLPVDWVEKVARMADFAHVIVVIDSLDVLSIARDHNVLKYFLGMIDQLLVIPNVTVVTACREFDRHYDPRISERNWDCELTCNSLDWDSDVEPLLDSIGIQYSDIDAVTRGLICNPRELGLYVELAKLGGSFNVVAGQRLAQRYLETIVRADSDLGDTAMQAIEEIASEMLKSRSLMVPYQRFNSPHPMLRKLCSLNVLQETHDGKLTFGHQTLLDVLVVSGALRQGIKLRDFIQNLPSVPFVRPSIRSFIAQLAVGDRSEFRKQVRSVLCGDFAFHVRRLVAEAFTCYPPEDEDWPLLRDLRQNYRDVFQVVYDSAISVDWHRFWLNYLVPDLISRHDSDGLAGHVYRISQWINEDAEGISSFWMNTLRQSWFDSNKVAGRISMCLSEFDSVDLSKAYPLIKRLVEMPRSDHDFLGRIIARCVISGVDDGSLLWRYITSGVSEDCLIDYTFENKLRCHSPDFGGKDKITLRQCMELSTVLLDLAIESVVGWGSISGIRYRRGFLNETSYEVVHSKRDMRHPTSLSFVLNAVEDAIIHHAKINSEWWKIRRFDVCSSSEPALRYFGILACSHRPENNVDLIGNILCEKDMYAPELIYEFGNLLNASFSLLDMHVQDDVTDCITTLWAGDSKQEENNYWILRRRAELISAIPCHQRSPGFQEILDECIKTEGYLIREPEIYSYSGFQTPPFSFEVFLDASDVGILGLLDHYAYYEGSCGSELLTGGEREVGWQLREASSRDPIRFLDFLKSFRDSIPEKFCDEIIEGASAFLDYRCGSLKPDESWKPVGEPEHILLANRILHELESRLGHWQYRKSAATAIKSCAHADFNETNAERLIFISIKFADFKEENHLNGSNIDLLTLGINMARGKIVEALMILMNKYQELDLTLPELLVPTVRRFASDENPAVRAILLRYLPYLQSLNSDLGWSLFHLAMKGQGNLWHIAEPCLYFAYDKQFEIVKPLLSQAYSLAGEKSLETWGRISALAVFSGHVDYHDLLRYLHATDRTEAWSGAATVWTNLENIKRHREQCVIGMENGLCAGGQHAIAVSRQMRKIFDTNLASIPIGLLRKFFSIQEVDSENNRHIPYRFHEWLSCISERDPANALDAIEAYIDYVRITNAYLYDHGNSLSQCLTRLFSEAEELENVDNGEMLRRVVQVQDALVSLGVDGVFDWLKAAERP